MTADEALMEFRAWLRVSNYRPASIRFYTTGLPTFWAFLTQSGITDLRRVTRADLEGYGSLIRRLSISRATKAQRIRSVQRLFVCLVETNQLLVNPATSLQSPSTSGLPRSILTVAEVKRLMAQPNTSLWDGIRDRALLELMYSTGLRLGEALSLTVYDLDLTTRLLSIRSGKGGKGRVVPLGKEATKWLREYLKKIRPKKNRLHPHERTLFLSYCGTPLRLYTWQALIQRYVKAAKIKKKVTCHSLRHTCATHLLEAGADLLAIKELLGHQRLTTTQQYTRVRPIAVKAMHQATHPRERIKSSPSRGGQVGMG
jgi:integrase/recombinase XerD